jgi:hypothetical protein
VLNPPLSFISFLIFMYISIAFAIWAAFDFLQAALTMGLLLLTIPFIWQSIRMVTFIDDQGELHVDRAHIELKYLKDAKALNEKDYRALRTRDFDARSFHATRAWLKRGVKVSVNDERDETTYWLIGTRKPEQLVAALNP